MVPDIHSLRTRRTEFDCTLSRRAKIDVPPSVHLRADVPGPGAPSGDGPPAPPYFRFPLYPVICLINSTSSGR
jgi:hypothetical protein